MKLTLDIRFFQSAIDDLSMPSFSPDSPHKVELIVDGSEFPLSVELTHPGIEEEQGDSLRVEGKTASPDMDYSALSDGTEFFVSEKGKMIGRGSVLSMSI